MRRKGRLETHKSWGKGKWRRRRKSEMEIRKRLTLSCQREEEKRKTIERSKDIKKCTGPGWWNNIHRLIRANAQQQNKLLNLFRKADINVTVINPETNYIYAEEESERPHLNLKWQNKVLGSVFTHNTDSLWRGTEAERMAK